MYACHPCEDNLLPCHLSSNPSTWCFRLVLLFPAWHAAIFFSAYPCPCFACHHPQYSLVSCCFRRTSSISCGKCMGSPAVVEPRMPSTPPLIHLPLSIHFHRFLVPSHPVFSFVPCRHFAVCLTYALPLTCVLPRTERQRAFPAWAPSAADTPLSSSQPFRETAEHSSPSAARVPLRCVLHTRTTMHVRLCVAYSLLQQTPSPPPLDTPSHTRFPRLISDVLFQAASCSEHKTRLPPASRWE